MLVDIRVYSKLTSEQRYRHCHELYTWGDYCNPGLEYNGLYTLELTPLDAEKRFFFDK